LKGARGKEEEGGERGREEEKGKRGNRKERKERGREKITSPKFEGHLQTPFVKQGTQLPKNNLPDSFRNYGTHGFEIFLHKNEKKFTGTCIPAKILQSPESFFHDFHKIRRKIFKKLKIRGNFLDERANTFFGVFGVVGEIIY
jgi:hypothetical protein